MTPKLSALFVTTILALAMSNANASWFGTDEEKPSNYEECLLDVMKGQERIMLRTAKVACEKKFPFVKELSASAIDLSWRQMGNGLELTIKENPENYEISRVKYLFSEKSCKGIKTADFGLEVLFMFDGQNNAFHLAWEAGQEDKARKYNCGIVKAIFGKMRK